MERTCLVLSSLREAKHSISLNFFDVIPFLHFSTSGLILFLLQSVHTTTQVHLMVYTVVFYAHSI